MSRKAIINTVLAVAMVAIFVVSFAIGGAARVNTENPEERFGGTDDKATTAIQEIDPNYQPWFSHFFEPASGEVESGLFAMQAAIGGAVLGFAIGGYWGRRKGEKSTAAGAAPAPSDAVPEPGA
jgi:cobalt/nickel transport protein